MSQNETSSNDTGSAYHMEYRFRHKKGHCIWLHNQVTIIKDAEFQEWFVSSNQTFRNFSGFISRRLLKPLKGGNYAAIVEFENQAAFQAMHGSSAHDKAGERVMPLFDGNPTPQFYEVVIG